MFRVILALALALPFAAQASPGRQHQAQGVSHHADDDGRRGERARKSRRDRKVAVNPRRLQKRVDAIDAELDALERLLADAPGAHPRGHHKQGRSHRRARHERAVAAQLAEIRARMKALHRTVAEAPPVPRRPKVRPRPAPPKAMSSAQLRRLTRAIDDARFRDDQRAVVRRAIRYNHFTSRQARVIAQQFAFSDDKVAVLTALHPRVIDPENFEQVFAELRFSSDRRQLDQNLYASNGRSRR